MFTLQSAGFLKWQYPLTCHQYPPFNPSLVNRGRENWLNTVCFTEKQIFFKKKKKEEEILFCPEALKLVHLQQKKKKKKRDPVALICKSHLFCTFFISKNVPFKPLDLSKCRFEFATLCTAFFILVFDYLILSTCR